MPNIQIDNGRWVAVTEDNLPVKGQFIKCIDNSYGAGSRTKNKIYVVTKVDTLKKDSALIYSVDNVGLERGGYYTRFLMLIDTTATVKEEISI